MATPFVNALHDFLSFGSEPGLHTLGAPFCVGRVLICFCSEAGLCLVVRPKSEKHDFLFFVGGWGVEARRHPRAFPEPNLVALIVGEYRPKPSHLDLFHAKFDFFVTFSSLCQGRKSLGSTNAMCLCGTESSCAIEKLPLRCGNHISVVQRRSAQQEDIASVPEAASVARGWNLSVVHAQFLCECVGGRWRAARFREQIQPTVSYPHPPIIVQPRRREITTCGMSWQNVGSSWVAITLHLDHGGDCKRGL